MKLLYTASTANGGAFGSIVVNKVREGLGLIRLQRGDGRVRGPHRGRRHRPDEGGSLGTAERGLGCVTDAHIHSAQLTGFSLSDADAGEGQGDAGRKNAVKIPIRETIRRLGPALLRGPFRSTRSGDAHEIS
mgnify:CR=1 FL=1